jgi:hypothetical protein
VAVVVAIIVLAILAVFALPKMFHVYHSSAGFGLRYGPQATSSTPLTGR